MTDEIRADPVESVPEPSAAVRREAAVWIARMHAPDRTPQVDAGLRRWLKESPEHQRAFDLANELWETAARIPDGALPRMMRWKRVAVATGFAFPRMVAAASMLLVLIAVLGGGLYFYKNGLFRGEPTIATAIGEQRSIILKDGTRVSLNTATRMSVRYDEKLRHVYLESGEALFDVARFTQWPFVVTAGDREIKALGTTFIVRRDEQKTVITLVEGKVAVSPAPAATGPDTALPEPQNPSSPGDSHPPETLTLMPGQRLTFAGGEQQVTVDLPELDKVTAWQRGVVALDYTPLAEAVAEMNRYSTTKLVIEEPEAAMAPISGVFRAGDSLFFAQAVAETYNLQVAEEPGRIILSGVPRE
jgi:transmembrane sensor